MGRNKPRLPQSLSTGTVRVDMPLADYLVSQFGNEAQALIVARNSMEFDWDAYEVAVAAEDVPPAMQQQRNLLEPFVSADESVKQVLMDHVMYDTWESNRPQ